MARRRLGAASDYEGKVIGRRRSLKKGADLQHEPVMLSHKEAAGFVIPMGPFNLVMVATDRGMVGCGAFDVAALDKFAYPAARVKSASGGAVATVEDVLRGIVKDANEEALKLGIAAGMTGREALERM